MDSVNDMNETDKPDVDELWRKLDEAEAACDPHRDHVLASGTLSQTQVRMRLANRLGARRMLAHWDTERFEAWEFEQRRAYAEIQILHERMVLELNVEQTTEAVRLIKSGEFADRPPTKEESDLVLLIHEKAVQELTAFEATAPLREEQNALAVKRREDQLRLVDAKKQDERHLADMASALTAWLAAPSAQTLDELRLAEGLSQAQRAQVIELSQKLGLDLVPEPIDPPSGEQEAGRDERLAVYEETRRLAELAELEAEQHRQAEEQRAREELDARNRAALDEANAHLIALMDVALNATEEEAAQAAEERAKLETSGLDASPPELRPGAHEDAADTDPEELAPPTPREPVTDDLDEDDEDISF